MKPAWLPVGAARHPSAAPPRGSEGPRPRWIGPWTPSIQRADGSGGFTLVEAVAALTIVGAVLVTGLAAVGADVRASRHVVEARRMAAAAGAALERVALRSRTALLQDRGGWRSLTSPLDRHRWRFRASAVADSPELLRVTVTVQSAAGGEETVTTLLFRPPPESSP